MSTSMTTPMPGAGSAPACDGRPVVPSAGALRPIGVSETRITGGFWGQRQILNRAIIDHIEYWQERVGWLGNFDAAARGTLPQARRGREFSDSEPYKLLEAMAWHLGWHDDAELTARYDAIVARIAAAQEPDGYLNTMFGRPGQGKRWSDLEWGHELYCLGHLMQSAVARVRTGHPQDLIVEVTRRAADLVCDVFGADGNQGVCGHPEVEVGLAEFGRAVGESRYIEQAARFVERRGHGVLADIEWGRAYYQDDVPVREAEVFRGHAVRANYLAAGAIDVAVEHEDQALLTAVTRQWERTVATRTYITGGQGSRHQDEGFGEDFQLPPDRAYSETCAGVGSLMVAWRLLLTSGAPRYADLMERTLYNVIATSPAHDGHAFYYSNTLHQRVPGEPVNPGTVSKRAESSLRAPFFEVSCCPPNVARTFASLAAYLATVTDDGVQVHQYAPARIRTVLPDGAAVGVDIITEYPQNGLVRVRVVHAPQRPWTLGLRVPDWSKDATLQVDRAQPQAGPAAPGNVPPDQAQPGGTVPGAQPEIDSKTVRRIEPGTCVIADLAVGDEVLLSLDVSPRFLVADERMDAVRGCVAVQRGPEVLCLESVDLPVDADVSAVRVDTSVPPREVDGKTMVRAVVVHQADRSWPYTAAGPVTGAAASGMGFVGRDTTEADPAAFDVALAPYHDWANRGPSTMRVWIPVR